MPICCVSGRLTVSTAWQRVAPYSSQRHPSSFAGALHLGIFEQPAENDLFNNLMEQLNGLPG